MTTTNKNNKGKLSALLPLAVFLIAYLATSIITGDFYKMPVSVGFLLAAGVAILMNPKRSIKSKVESFTEGMGHQDIMVMCLIFLLAGAFAQVGRAMGAIESTVNLGLTLLPSNVLISGLFIIACFISLSIGTSVGTIVALSPIAVAVGEELNIAIGLALGAVIGGAMFGDNLSMISDTTIAASRTQGTTMRDKFHANIRIVIPAAIITTVIYFIMGWGNNTPTDKLYDYEALKVLPYIAVLVVALLGVNVIIVLTGGTVLAGIIGILSGSFDIWGFIDALKVGMSGMSDLVIICLLVGGTVELVKINGGIDFIIKFILDKVNSKKGAELGIAFLITLVDCCTANNTVAIIIVGPITKDIANKFGISPKRAASLLDTFSCFAQGTIPYGAQILSAVGIAGVAINSPFEVMQYLYYPYLMGASALLFILLGKKTKENTATHKI